MIRALSLAAALALLPVSAAVAQDQKTQAEVQLEAAASAFEAKMEEFGERAEAIQDNDDIDDTAKGLRIAALWSEYQPHVAAFTSLATQQAGEIAQQALAEIDIDAVVAEALADVEPMMQGLMTNGAWAQADPDQMVTYGLMADYAVGQSLDAIEEVHEAFDLPLEPPTPPAPPAEA